MVVMEDGTQICSGFTKNKDISLKKTILTRLAQLQILEIVKKHQKKVDLLHMVMARLKVTVIW